jgi:hypothetical protein
MRIDQKFNQLLLIANNHARLIGYTPLAKMAVFSKLANNPRAVAAVATCVAGVSLYVYVRNNVSSSKKKKDDVYIAATKDSKDSRKKTAVDMHFLKCFGRLLKILVPSVFCPESAFLVMVAIMLILRTYADVWMIQNGTVIEGSIIGRNFQGFKENVSNFLFAMPFISIINILLKVRGLDVVFLAAQAEVFIVIVQLYYTLPSFMFNRSDNIIMTCNIHM